MRRIQKEIVLVGNNGAGNLQDGRGTPSDPFVSDHLKAGRRGFVQPFRRQFGEFQAGDQSRIKPDFDHYIVLQNVRGFEMHQYLKDSKGLGLRSVHDGDPRRVPAASVEAGALSVECVCS